MGNFKNPGSTWRRDTRDVLDHDFPSWADGRAIPFGVYDIELIDPSGKVERLLQGKVYLDKEVTR